MIEMHVQQENTMTKQDNQHHQHVKIVDVESIVLLDLQPVQIFQQDVMEQVQIKHVQIHVQMEK